MTIIIAAKTRNSVIFASDTLRVDIDPKGNTIKQTETDIQKVVSICKEAIIGTAGLGTLSHASVETIRGLIAHQQSVSRENILECCESILRFNHDEFNRWNPHVAYDKMAALVGGIDQDSGLPFLHFYHSDLKFKRSLDIDIEIIGSGAELIRESVSQEYLKHSDGLLLEQYARFFSDSIRYVSQRVGTVGRKVDVVEVKSGTYNYYFFDENGTILNSFPSYFKIQG